MKKLTALYLTYFQYQEELHAIQHDKKNWPEGWEYADMVHRVNKLTPEVRRIAQQIKKAESALEFTID